jgi:hypothetical protein
MITAIRKMDDLRGKPASKVYHAPFHAHNRTPPEAPKSLRASGCSLQAVPESKRGIPPRFLREDTCKSP